MPANNDRGDGRHIALNTIAAKGDVVVGSDEEIPTVVSIGDEGQVFTVGESGTPVWADASGGGGGGSALRAVFSGTGGGVGATDTDNAVVDTLTVYDADGVDVTVSQTTFDIDEDGYPVLAEPGLYIIEARFSFSAALDDETAYTPVTGFGPAGIGQYIPTGVVDRTFVFLPAETVKVASTSTLNGIHVTRSVNSYGVVTVDHIITVTKLG